MKSTNIIEILTDPWSEKSAIWEFDIDSLEFVKIRDFIKYQKTEFTNKIEW
ncbi:MAG: hypothetical protein ACPKPY_05905 [Nitrososphaeraceae archaeon]